MNTKSGYKLSKETRKKMSLARLGKPGHKPTKATKKKISDALKGRKLAPDILEKYRVAQRKRVLENRNPNFTMKGKHHSKKSIAKIRKSNLGLKRTPQQIENNRKARIGKTLSEETRRKIGAKHKGKNNHCWRGGGKTQRRNSFRLTRTTIHHRDHHQCIKCGTERVDVHHIIPYRYIQYYNIAHEDKTNLICLCRKHHFEAEYSLSQSIPSLRKFLSKTYGYTYPSMRRKLPTKYY